MTFRIIWSCRRVGNNFRTPDEFEEKSWRYQLSHAYLAKTPALPVDTQYGVRKYHNTIWILAVGQTDAVADFMKCLL